jgi:hypothetical protein
MWTRFGYEVSYFKPGPWSRSGTFFIGTPWSDFKVGTLLPFDLNIYCGSFQCQFYIISSCQIYLWCFFDHVFIHSNCFVCHYLFERVVLIKVDKSIIIMYFSFLFFYDFHWKSIEVLDRTPLVWENIYKCNSSCTILQISSQCRTNNSKNQTDHRRCYHCTTLDSSGISLPSISSCPPFRDTRSWYRSSLLCQNQF